MNWILRLTSHASLICLSMLLPLGTLVGCSAKSAPPAAAELMCNEHGVPERFCIICHPELKSKLLMCQEHGVPEEICTICHPEAIEKYGLKVCKEHGLPESLCPKCHPALKAGEVKSDWCPEHGVPKSLCTICDPELVKSLPMCAEHGLPQAICTICRPELAKNFVTCKRHNLPAAFCTDPVCLGDVKLACDTGNLSKDGVKREDESGKDGMQKKSAALPLIRLAGPDVAQKAGIAAVPALQTSLSPLVAANGEVGYDETHLAHVRPRVSGVISEVLARPGDAVRRGQVLAVVDSAELGQAKADYLAAQPLVELWTKTHSRQQGLDQQGVIAGKQVFEAQSELQRSEAELLKATQRLRNFGIDKDQTALLRKKMKNIAIK